MTDVLLAATGLEVGRGAPLLSGVDLELRPGEAWFVLGRNGAGKSTLLATLLGLLAPRHGTIQAAPAIADRSALGFVPQETTFSAPLPLTVAEFVDLGLATVTATRSERRARVAVALQQLGIEDLAPRQVASLSLGQRRRALVARALLRRPRLLVLDEPTANLDAHGAATLCADLDRLRRDSGVCLLHVAHDLGLVRRFATHVLLLAGAAVHAGPVAAMLAAPILEQTLGVGTN